MDIDKLKNIVQDCNINFLFGSGMSAPYLSILGNIETLLADAENITDANTRDIIQLSLYKLYFDSVIKKNIEILDGDASTQKLMNSYKSFFEIFNRIILERRNTLLSKQINIFTTNIDICLEKALEDKGFEYNDGFSGNFNPKFDLSNYKKSLFKRSLHFENVSEIPMFNIYKIHGSLTWKINEGHIVFSKELEQIKKIDGVTIPDGILIDIQNKDAITNLETKAGKITSKSKKTKDFRSEYEKLAIVNPTKDKFRETILNQTYYELLRIYANELEKENTVLFVMGFSFADEHIKELTLRVANSNPTLQIFIFAYNNDSKSKLELKIGIPRHNNIKIISPEEGDEKNLLYTFDEINTKYAELKKKVLEGQ